MDDESLMDFFANCECDDKILEKIKPDYEVIHLPLSIIKILKMWEENDICEDGNNRIGICPCDYQSIDSMFIHTWGESHVEQPSRLTSIIDYIQKYFYLLNVEK